MEQLTVNQNVLDELVKGMVSILQDNVISIVLYGSVARGTNTWESDVDIAILLRNPISRETRDQLDDFLGEMDLKHDKLFSVIDITEKMFETWKNAVPFYKNVSEEGIVLWKAA